MTFRLPRCHAVVVIFGQLQLAPHAGKPSISMR
jgi:hypothetical protein